MRHRTKCLTASKPIVPNSTAWRAAAATSGSGKSSSKRNTCTYSRLPALPSRTSSKRLKRHQLFGQLPTHERRGLIQRVDLALQQGQVMQRIEDQLFALVTAPMPGDLFVCRSK